MRHRTHCANNYKIVIHTIRLLEPWSLEIVLHKRTNTRKWENKLFRINCIRTFEFQKAFVMMIRLSSTELCFLTQFIGKKDACNKAYKAQNIMGYIRCNRLRLSCFKLYIISGWFLAAFHRWIINSMMKTAIAIIIRDKYIKKMKNISSIPRILGIVSSSLSPSTTLVMMRPRNLANIR